MRSPRKLASISAVLTVAVAGVAIAQTIPDHSTGPAHMQGMDTGQHPSMRPGHMSEMMRQHRDMVPMGGMHGTSSRPTLPGQGAFGAIQEVVSILDADPKTNWSKVDLEALRQHLIDMDEVTLKAEAALKQIDGGLEITITGSGRTLTAIQRMIPAYAQTINGLNGCTAKADTLPNGELLAVTATDPKEVQHIRGLGFIGLLASGSHHQQHHLAMAKGELDQEHLHKH
jgi:hypothetical protein